jgi:hypothetical protein
MHDAPHRAPKIAEVEFDDELGGPEDLYPDEGDCDDEGADADSSEGLQPQAAPPPAKRKGAKKGAKARAALCRDGAEDSCGSVKAGAKKKGARK